MLSIGPERSIAMKQTAGQRRAESALKPLKKPPVKKSSAKNDSRDRMLEAASVAFLTGGFHSIGVAEICTNANVRKGTFYHFFPSKTDLLLEVIELHVQKVEEAIGAVSQSKITPARKIIRLFTMAHLQSDAAVSSGPLPGYFLGNLVLELASSTPSVQLSAKAAFDRWNSAIKPIAEQFLNDEGLQSLDAEGVADTILGLLQGGLVMASAYNDPRKMRAFGHLALTLLRASDNP